MKVSPTGDIIQMKSCIGKVSHRKTIVWWTGYLKLTRSKKLSRHSAIISFSVSGENCWAEAGDDVLAASLLVLECEVPGLLPGELQHLLRGVRAQVRLEEAEEEEGGQPRGGTFFCFDDKYWQSILKVEVAFEDPDTGNIIRETVEVWLILKTTRRSILGSYKICL